MEKLKWKNHLKNQKNNDMMKFYYTLFKRNKDFNEATHYQFHG